MAKRSQSTTVNINEFLRELASEVTTNERFQHTRTGQTNKRIVSSTAHAALRLKDFVEI